MRSIPDGRGDLIAVVAVESLSTNGASIPPGLSITYTNRSDGQPLTATQTDGTDTWVYTWTYDESGFVTNESGWVMQ